MRSLLNYPRLIITLLGLLILGSAVGQRLPWHVDEVRFVGVALEMMQGGNWLVPHRAGEIYADKPPIFFWLMALVLTATQSVRWSFLLPGVLSGVACLLLVYDLGKRWWNARVGLCAAILLLASYQFWRICTAAHIDCFLVLCTTLGVYGFARHMHSGKDPAWLFAGFIAVSIGILSKGVGFLPLLMAVPFIVLRMRGAAAPISAVQWLTGAVLMLCVLLFWLVPLLVRAGSDTEIKLYLDDILFRQTGKRFVNAWQHREPFWFFLAAIPKYWAPLSLILPWLIPAWYRRLRRLDARYVLLLGWAALVLVFFSASTGKRELYILPALPIVALAAAPITLALIRKLWVRRVATTATWMLITLTFAAAAAIVSDLLPDSRIATWPNEAGWALLVMSLIAAVAAIALRKRANPVFSSLVSYGLLIIVYHRALLPLLDTNESGRAAMRALSDAAQPASLALMKWDEKNWLYSSAPLLHNGKFSDINVNLCSTADKPFVWVMPAEQADELGLQAINAFSLKRKKSTAIVEPLPGSNCTQQQAFKYQFAWSTESLRLIDR